MKTFYTTIVLLAVTFIPPGEKLLFARGEQLANEQVVRRAFVSHSLSFTRNDGQIDTKGRADCRFYTHQGGANFFFCADGVVADFQQRFSRDVIARSPVKRDDEAISSRLEFKGIASLSHLGETPRNDVLNGHVLKVNFLGRTNFLGKIAGEEEKEYRCNYFIGNVPEKWHTSVPNYGKVNYKDVWQGIDIAYYGANGVGGYDPLQTASLKYDVIVHPGANPSQILFAYEGDDGLSISEGGALVLKTSVGDVIEQTPYVYQIIDGKKKEVSSQFVISLRSYGRTTLRSVVSFFVGDYDKTRDLVIDPTYSTFLGGSRYDFGAGIAVDAGGNAYVTGFTQSTDFPTTVGAYRRTFNGFNGYPEAFVTKVNPFSSDLVYSTFLGGSTVGGEDRGAGIAVDAGGNAYVTGYTSKTDFPTTTGAYQTTYSGIPNKKYNAFLTKFKPNGDSLAFSTYLGGAVNDFGCAVAVDIAGCAFVTGFTESVDFPHTPGAYDTISKGSPDAFVTKFNPAGSTLLYSTFLGGAVGGYPSPYTYGFAIALDKHGNAYVTGFTTCHDFPTTPGAYQSTVPTTKLGSSVFVTKLKPKGDSLAYSTYFGGSYDDKSTGIAVDAGGNAYVTGYTWSDDFPVYPKPGAYQKTHNTGGTYHFDLFVTKLNSSGSTLGYSTYLGGSNDDWGTGIAVDAAGNAYVTGYTLSSDFPTTAGADQTTYHAGGYDGYDAFVTKVNSSGSMLGYSTFMGGSNDDQGAGIAVDVEGGVYVTGTTSSSDFRTTAGAFQQKLKGLANAFVTKFSFAPAIVVADTLNFDSVRCIEDQTTLSIENISVDFALKIDTMTISGPDRASFSFINPPKFPIVISSLGNTQIVLQLARNGAVGKKMATLSIHSNDDAPLSDTLKKVTLIGIIDSVGVITLEKNITFGNLRCEEVSYDTVVRVKNTGLQSVTIVPTVSGQNATSFTVTPTDTTISAGGIGRFNVHFQPSGKGSSAAHIQFSSNDCGMIFDTTYVSGSKISSVSLSSYPSLLDFGEHCHSTVIDSFITVYNMDSGTVILEHPVETGNGLTVTPDSSVTLAAGDSVRYHVRFTSSGVGNYQGTITIGGKPCNINVSLQLRGTEVEPPKITLSNATVFFDTLDCNEPERYSKVKVKNVGTRSITLKPVVTGDATSYHIQPDTAFVLFSNKFRNITITFHPDSVGQKTAYLFFDDLLCGLLKDSVTLSGFKKSVGAITGKPLSLRFDTVNCENGDIDASLSIWIKNTGTETLNLNSPTVSGGVFAIKDASGVLGLAPGDSIEYIIDFSPNSNGAYTGTFKITGSCNVLFTCSLVGVCSSTSGVENSGIESMRRVFLGQNYPNPFSRLSIVGYQLSEERPQGLLEVRDMLGRVVYHTSVSGKETQVSIDAAWLPNGMYLYSLNDGKNIQSRIMMVSK